MRDVIAVFKFGILNCRRILGQMRGLNTARVQGPRYATIIHSSEKSLDLTFYFINILRYFYSELRITELSLKSNNLQLRVIKIETQLQKRQE